MFNAQYLRTGESVLTPWFTRGGDSLTFTADVVALSNAKLTVAPLTKNREDTGSGTVADSAKDLVTTTVGRKDQTVESGGTGNQTTGFKELVRYKLQVTVDPPEAEGGWILFRMLPPVWYETVKTS